MKKLQRLVDAKSAKKHFLKVGQPAEYKGVIHWVVPCSEIDNIPTVDAVEVVQCKDCEWYDGILCTNLYGLTFCNPDSFCCYGERKET